ASSPDKPQRWMKKRHPPYGESWRRVDNAKLVHRGWLARASTHLRGQRQPYFHAAFDVTDLQLAAMQFHHFLHEVQAQAGALAPAVGARQGVETFGQARQSVVGDRLALVEQPQHN